MCRATTCHTCGKTTWAGCGQHIASVKRNVPTSNWCNGTHTRADLEAAQEKARERRGFFGRLFAGGKK